VPWAAEAAQPLAFWRAHRLIAPMEDAVAVLSCCAATRVLCRWAKLACALRSATAVTTHLALAREVRACIVCVRLALPGDTIYSCGICEDRHDLCARCHDDTRQLGVGVRSSRADLARHPMHEEVLPLLVETAPLLSQVRGRSTADTLARAFRLYAPRRCLGTRQAVAPHGRGGGGGGGGYGEYEWLTYAQTLQAALNFGTGLQALITRVPAAAATAESGAEPPPLVGVLGAVCRDWLISDYGCALKGIGVVLMHRATDAAQLGHILRQTGMRALVISRHLRHVLRGALRADPGSSVALRHVVWLDDPVDAHAQASLVAGGGADGVADRSSTAGAGVTEHRWEGVAESGAAQPAETRQRVVDSLGADAIIKLLPSSGTTGGAPKLTVVTEGTLREKIAGSSDPAKKSLAGTVVAFAYEVMRQSHDVVLQGGSIGFFSGSLVRIEEDCQRLRPSAFAATPTCK
jgi:hypothetical protein